MLVVETIAKIRRAFFKQGKAINSRSRGGQQPSCPSLARGPGIRNHVLGLVKEQAIGLWH